MDADTQRWLADLAVLDTMLGMADDLGDDAARQAVTKSLQVVASQAVPAGVAVRIADRNGDGP